MYLLLFRELHLHLKSYFFSINTLFWPKSTHNILKKKNHNTTKSLIFSTKNSGFKTGVWDGIRDGGNGWGQVSWLGSGFGIGVGVGFRVRDRSRDWVLSQGWVSESSLVLRWCLGFGFHDRRPKPMTPVPKPNYEPNPYFRLKIQHRPSTSQPDPDPQPKTQPRP